jgi:hypothetical protein
MVKRLVNFCYAFLASAKDYEPTEDQWRALYRRASALKITSADREKAAGEMQAAQRERERELSAQSKREELDRVSDISQQPPVKLVKKLYTDMLVRYGGPEPRLYGQYNVRYRPDKELCKD